MSYPLGLKLSVEATRDVDGVDVDVIYMGARMIP